MKNTFYSIICFMLVLTLFMSMSACSIGESKQSNQADYKIIQKNGEYFILFDDLSTYQEDAQLVQVATISFDSMKEFKDSVTKGQLTEGQKKIMANSFQRDSAGAIMVCDFNNLYVPTLPEDGSVNGVVWSGQAYSFGLGFDNKIYGWIKPQTEAQYDERYQNDYIDFFENDKITVTKTETLEDGKVATYYSTSAGQLMNIRYTLKTDNQTIVVDKRFCLQMDSPVPTSATVPLRVELYCTSEEGFYYVYLSGFAEDPTDEWLASFGLQKYVDNDHVAK